MKLLCANAVHAKAFIYTTYIAFNGEAMKILKNIMRFWMLLIIGLTPSMRALGLVCTSHIARLSIFGFAMLLFGFPVYAQDQYLLVSNREGRDVLRYNADTGAFVDVFIPAQTGGMNVPYGMTLGPDGNLYVVSTRTEIYPGDDLRVLKFDSHSGDYLGTFASDSAMEGPADLAFGPDGNLYVADGSANVFRFDGNTGASMGVFASGDVGDSYRGLAWGPDGNLYVGTVSNHFDRFDGATGASLGILPTPQASSIHNVIFGPDGLLYGGDYFGNSVYAYDIVTGELVKSFDGLSGANGLIFDNNGELLVSSYFENQIVRFGSDSGSPGIVFTSGHPLNGPLDLVVLAVPEPSTYAMLLAGLGLLGFAARRGKQRTRQMSISLLSIL